MVEEGLPEGVFDSASAGSFHAVAAWLNEGGGVDARYAEQGRATLLIAAAFGGQEAMVRMLLQRGASVGLQASGGSTALMAAALRGHTTIVQVLLDAKADARAALQQHPPNTLLTVVLESVLPSGKCLSARSLLQTSLGLITGKGLRHTHGGGGAARRRV